MITFAMKLKVFLLQTSGVADICNALLFAISKLEQQWTLQWRPLAKISLSLGEISRVFTQEQIYHKLIPFAFKLLTLNVSNLPTFGIAGCEVSDSIIFE